MITLGTFPLQLDNIGGSSVCIYQPATDPTLTGILANNSNLTVFFEGAVLNLFFQVNNSTNQEIWAVLTVSDINDQGSFNATKYYPVLGQTQTETSIELQFVEFSNTNDIFGTFEGIFGQMLAIIGLQNLYTVELLISKQDVSIIPDYNEQYASILVKQVQFTPAANLQLTQREPTTLIDSLSRLGGLLAIVNFTFIIAYINEKCFERKIKQFLLHSHIVSQNNCSKSEKREHNNYKDDFSTLSRGQYTINCKTSNNIITGIDQTQEDILIKEDQECKKIFSFENYLQLLHDVDMLKKVSELDQKYISHSEKDEQVSRKNKDSLCEEMERQLEYQWLGDTKDQSKTNLFKDSKDKEIAKLRKEVRQTQNLLLQQGKIIRELQDIVQKHVLKST